MKITPHAFIAIGMLSMPFSACLHAQTNPSAEDNYFESEEYLESIGLEVLSVKRSSDSTYYNPELLTQSFRRVRDANYTEGFATITTFIFGNNYNTSAPVRALSSGVFNEGELNAGEYKSFVLDRAKTDKNRGIFQMNVGSYDFYQSALDYNLALNESSALRVNATSVHQNSDFDYEESQFDAITLAGAHQLTDRTKLIFSAEHFKNDESKTGVPPKLYYDYNEAEALGFVGNERDTGSTTSFYRPLVSSELLSPDKAGSYVGPSTGTIEAGEMIFLSVEHEVSDVLRAEVSFLFEDVTEDVKTSSVPLIDDNFDGTFNVTDMKWIQSDQAENNQALRGRLFYDFLTDWTEQTLRLTAQRVEYEYDFEEFRQYGDRVNPTTNVNSPNFNTYSLIPASNTANNITSFSGINRFGNENSGYDDVRFLRSELVSAQTDINTLEASLNGSYFDGRLLTLGELRYDRTRTQYSRQDISTYTNEDLSTASETYDELGDEFIDDEFSLSFASLFWLNEKFAVFGSYAESSIDLLEQINFDDVSGKMLPMNRLSAYEIGLLSKMYDERLIVQVTGFQQFYDENDQGPNEELREQGVELAVFYNPNANFSAKLEYAFIDAEYLESDVFNGAQVGDAYNTYREHQAQLSLRYTFMDGALNNLYFDARFSYDSEILYDNYYYDNGDGVGIADTTRSPYEDYLEPALDVRLSVGWRTPFTLGSHRCVFSTNLSIENALDNDQPGLAGRYPDPPQFVWKTTIVF